MPNESDKQPYRTRRCEQLIACPRDVVFYVTDFINAFTDFTVK